MQSKKNYFEYLVIFLLISFALYLCFINNYGWDWDTYAMLDTFLNLKDEGIYIKSRGAGYLIPEIGIGFLAYNFGSTVINFVTFLFLIIGLFYFFKAGVKLLKFEEDYSLNFILFLILCLSNHIIMRDSTIPMDYSWSFMMYSIGLYALTIKKYEIAILFFSLCFGSRFNFIIFIIPTIVFFDNNTLNLEKKIIHILIIVFFGCLFYVPSWLQSQFSLSFIYSEQAMFKKNAILSIEEVARFLYKILKTFGIISLLFILYQFLKLKNVILKYKFYLILILFNFILFFVFPWEPSFLWLSIVSIFLILVLQINYKMIYLLIFFNLFNWFYQLEIVRIKYVKNNCFKSPISANISLHFTKGLVLSQQNRLDDVRCYPDLLGSNTKIMNYREKILSGRKLK